jgi:hypothetical protein
MTIARLLEILNGVQLIPALLLIVLFMHYLSRESVRRGLPPWAWLKFPPSMSLALASFVLVTSLTLHMVGTSIWYRVGQKLLPVQMIYLVSDIGIITGMLCMLRTITAPDYGRAIWFITLVTVVVLTIVLFFFG